MLQVNKNARDEGIGVQSSSQTGIYVLYEYDSSTVSANMYDGRATPLLSLLALLPLSITSLNPPLGPSLALPSLLALLAFPLEDALTPLLV